MREPLAKVRGSPEDAEYRVQADQHQGRQLDEGLEGDGDHQPLVFFTGRDVPGAEKDSE